MIRTVLLALLLSLPAWSQQPQIPIKTTSGKTIYASNGLEHGIRTGQTYHIIFDNKIMGEAIVTEVAAQTCILHLVKGSVSADHYLTILNEQQMQDYKLHEIKQRQQRQTLKHSVKYLIVGLVVTSPIIMLIIK